MELLTVEETAKMLKVAPITVRRYIQSGRLPAVKVGRGVRLRREAVEALLTPIGPSLGARNILPPGEPTSDDDPLWHIMDAADADSVSPADAAGSTSDDEQPISADDSLWNIVGIVGSDDEEPTDVARNKHKYVAEAYASDRG